MKQRFSGPVDVARAFGVSRETSERLTSYAELLTTWNAKINLVGPETIPNLWERHIADSAQLFRFIPRDSSLLLDVGSGAGFPGLVLAIMGVRGVHLVESDQRKCAFLREAARITDTVVTVHSERLEKLGPFPAQVLTARAVAAVGSLLEWTEAFRGPETVCLFLKGQTVEAELTEACKHWTMHADRFESLTDVRGTILALREVRRVRDNSARDPVL